MRCHSQFEGQEGRQGREGGREGGRQSLQTIYLLELHLKCRAVPQLSSQSLSVPRGGMQCHSPAFRTESRTNRNIYSINNFCKD